MEVIIDEVLAKMKEEYGLATAMSAFKACQDATIHTRMLSVAYELGREHRENQLREAHQLGLWP